MNVVKFPISEQDAKMKAATRKLVGIKNIDTSQAFDELLDAIDFAVLGYNLIELYYYEPTHWALKLFEAKENYLRSINHTEAKP